MRPRQRTSLRYCVLIVSAVLAACQPQDASFRAVGELASNRVELTVESNESIIALPVAEGSTIAKGQVLLSQDSARAQAQVLQSQAALDQERARLAERVRGPRGEQIAAARAAAQGATQELAFRKAEQTRVAALFAQDLSSSDALDKAAAALDAASASVDVRRAQLRELLAGTTLEELAQAEAAVAKAAATLQLAEIDLQRQTLRAPIDGVLDSRLFEVGERPAIGQTVLVLLGGDQVHARVFVPEQIRARVSVGSDAQIYVDGLAAPIPGRVRWIANEAAFTPYYALTEHDRSRLSYVAKIDITERRERLPDGVPVEVEFVLD